MTHNFDSVLPLMLVGVVASGVAYVLYKNSVVTEKLVRRGFLIPQDYEADIFKRVPVSEVMDTDFQTVSSDMTAGELNEKILRGDDNVNRHKGIPIVDRNNHLAGIITHNDVRRAVQNGMQDKTVLEVGNTELVLAFPTESLYEAVVRMLHHDVGRLPVVNRDDIHAVVGYLGRSQVISARLKKLAEDGIIPPEVANRRSDKKKPTENI